MTRGPIGRAEGRALPQDAQNAAPPALLTPQCGHVIVSIMTSVKSKPLQEHPLTCQLHSLVLDQPVARRPKGKGSTDVFSSHSTASLTIAPHPPLSLKKLARPLRNVIRHRHARWTATSLHGKPLAKPRSRRSPIPRSRNCFSRTECSQRNTPPDSPRRPTESRRSR